MEGCFHLVHKCSLFVLFGKQIDKTVFRGVFIYDRDAIAHSNKDSGGGIAVEAGQARYLQSFSASRSAVRCWQ